MVERLGPFQGIFPKLAADALPPGGAAAASDCQFSKGALSLAAFTGTAQSLNDGTDLTGEIAEADVVELTPPSAPVLSDNCPIRLCQPLDGLWLTITATSWQQYMSPTSGTLQTVSREQSVTINSVEWTPTGLLLNCTLGDAASHIELAAGIPNTLRGPRFKFSFSADTGGGGGPDAEYAFPATPTIGDDVLPECAVPLKYDYGDSSPRIYGYFTPTGYSGPLHDRDNYAVDQASTLTFPGGEVTFTIDLNYLDQRVRYYRFCQALVDGSGREGPPSDVSPLIEVVPGEQLELALYGAVATGGQRLLYRAGDGAADFRLLDVIEAADDTGSALAAHEWRDAGQAPQDISIPPYGNYTAAGAASKAAFLKNSLLHPAGYGIAAAGGTLWVSDSHRLHAWPPEWSFTPPEAFVAMAMIGGTAIIFTTTKVWAFSSDNPERPFLRLLSASHPLLSKLSICRAGGRLLWISTDGLCATGGGEVEVVTREHWTRTEFAALTPAGMKAAVLGSRVLLTGGASDLWFDLDSGQAAYYTSATPSAYAWTSGVLRHERPTIYGWARVEGGAATLKVYRGASLLATATLPAAGTRVSLADSGYAPGLSHQFKIEGSADVRQVELYEREVLPAQPVTALDMARVPVWEDIWLEFQDRGRFVAGCLGVTAGTVKVALQSQAGELYWRSGELTSGAAFYPPRALTGEAGAINPLASMLRVAVMGEAEGSPAALSDAPLAGLTLYQRQTVRVEGAAVESHDGQGVPAWRIRTYDFGRPVYLKSLRVKAGATVYPKFYLDGAEAAAEITELDAGVEDGEIRLATTLECQTLEVEFVDGLSAPADADVRAFEVRAQALSDIGPGPLIVPEPPRGLLKRFEDVGGFACGAVTYQPATGAASGWAGTVALYKDFAATAAWSRDLSATATPSVQTQALFLLPRDLAAGSVWELDTAQPAATKGRILAVALYPRQRVAVQGGFSRANPGTGVPAWCYEAYDIIGALELASIRVHFTGTAPTLKMWKDGSTSATPTFSTASKALQSGVERTVTGMSGARSFDFNFGEDDERVTLVEIFFKESVPIPPAGWVERGAAAVRSWRNRTLEFAEAGAFASARVVASRYPLTLKLTQGATVYSLTVASAAETKFNPALPTGKSWPLDVTETVGGVEDGYGGRIEEFCLFGDAVEKIGASGLIVREADGSLNTLGRRLAFKETGSFSAVRVLADNYGSGAAALTLTLTPAGGSPVETALTDSGAVKLPYALATAREWGWSLSGGAGRREVHLYGRVAYPLKGGVVSIEQAADPFVWLDRRVLCGGAVSFAAGRLDATGGATLRLFSGGVQIVEQAILPGGVFRLPLARREREWSVDLLPDAGVEARRLELATSLAALK